MRAAFVFAVVLAMLFAGCTGFAPAAIEGADVDGAGPASAPPRDAAPVFLAADPSAPGLTPIPARVTLERAWLRPYQPAAATLSTTPGTDVAWFLQAEDDDVLLTRARGSVYASEASTPQQHHHHAPGTEDHPDAPEAPPASRRRADLDELAPGGRPGALVFALEGRFLLATPGGATVNVTVRSEALPGPTDAFLVGPGAGARFVPDELDVPPGARVLFWNQASAATGLREVAYLARVPGTADGVEFVPIDEGLWRLHAVVRDGARGFGTTSAPFLVDFERPAERVEIGPTRGRLAQADASLPEVEERSLSVSATFPLKRLDLAFNASTPLPAPGSVRVLVVGDDGRTHAEASSLETATLSIEDLPAGRYDIVVRGEQGAFVDYELAGLALYELPTPARLLAAS